MVDLVVDARYKPCPGRLLALAEAVQSLAPKVLGVGLGCRS